MKVLCYSPANLLSPTFSIRTPTPPPCPSKLTPFPRYTLSTSSLVPCSSAHLTRTSANLPVGLTALGHAALSIGTSLSIKAYVNGFFPSLSFASCVSSMKAGRTL